MPKEFLERKGIAFEGGTYQKRSHIIKSVFELVPDKVWNRVDKVVSNPGKRGGIVRPSKNNEKLVVEVNFIPTATIETAHNALHELGHVAEEILKEKGYGTNKEWEIKNGQLLADFFAMYVMDGKSLRDNINNLDSERKDFFHDIYDGMKKHVFDGKEFNQKDVEHITRAAQEMQLKKNEGMKALDVDPELIIPEDYTPFTHRVLKDMRGPKERVLPNKPSE